MWSRRSSISCANLVAFSPNWASCFLISGSVAIVRNIRLSFGMWLRVDSFPFMYMVASRRKFSSAVVLVFLFTVFALPAFSRPHCDICAFFMHKTRFYLFKVLRRNKNSSCVRLPVKVHFRTRIYSTHQRKLLSLISHLCKKVNRRLSTFVIYSIILIK